VLAGKDRSGTHGVRWAWADRAAGTGLTGLPALRLLSEIVDQILFTKTNGHR
jgi:hypothetical protein